MSVCFSSCVSNSNKVENKPNNKGYVIGIIDGDTYDLTS